MLSTVRSRRLQQYTTNASHSRRHRMPAVDIYRLLRPIFARSLLECPP